MAANSLIPWTLIFAASAASGAQTMEQCLLHSVQSADAHVTVGELRTLCQQQLSQSPQTPPEDATTQAAATAANAEGPVEKRLALERYSHDNPFVLTPHRPNYLLPAVYSPHRNAAPYNQMDPDYHLQHTEIQFQLSLKVLVLENLIGNNGHLSFAYTNRSFWQAYNDSDSAPFRETNHEPEMIFSLENDWTIFGFRNSVNQFILSHQSNGRAGQLSRSWNRLELNSIFERDNFIFSIKPWYRIPESKKKDPTSAEGDDNPDIERYMGYFEWQGVYQAAHGQTLSLLVRNNLRLGDNKGALELGYSFPIGHSRLKGYVKYFNGFGESLIDYNYRIQSLGVGILFSDWL